MKSFNVIIEDNGKFMPYDVMPYLWKKYQEVKDDLEFFDDVKNFVEKESKYQWWARCEYEIILSGWPNQKVKEKWDVYDQIVMNLDIIAEILIDLEIEESMKNDH